HAGLDQLLVELAHRRHQLGGRQDAGLAVRVGLHQNHEPHQLLLCLLPADAPAKRTAAIGGNLASSIVQESPESSEIHSPPVVEPKASNSPVASTASACRHTRS